jgi:hypothetical protein
LNKSEFFLQATRQVQNHTTCVDFYFYEDDPNVDYLQQRWNFTGQYMYKFNFMHIPREMIFPIRSKIYLDTPVCVPNFMENCCEYLYGSNWKVPSQKNKEYKIFIYKNRPKIVYGWRGKIIHKIIRIWRKLSPINSST